MRVPIPHNQARPYRVQSHLLSVHPVCPNKLHSVKDVVSGTIEHIGLTFGVGMSIIRCTRAEGTGAYVGHTHPSHIF